jgi:hypothetical protein
MLATPSVIPARPEPDHRQHRLTAQFADMIPGASTIRVGAFDPVTSHPRPYVSASDVAGGPVALSRTTAKIVARWVRRAWPDADWTRAHVLHLATATLAPVTSDEARGR